MFQDLGSSPATMEAAKAADAYGLCPGYDVEQADAEQAYVQADLKGPTTWVSLPPEARPPQWKDMKRPVCPLVKALYGHPDSGTFWEETCDNHCKEQGFSPIKDWPSCYFQHKLRLFLVIYVDDFKLAGPKGNLAEGWRLLRTKSLVTGEKGLDIEEPAPIGRYLGCLLYTSDAADE